MSKESVCGRRLRKKASKALCVLIYLLHGPVFAEDSNLNYALTDALGAAVSVFDRASQRQLPVVRTDGGDRPADCPPDGFWASSANPYLVLRCRDDKPFELSAPTDSSMVPIGAKVLKPVSKPPKPGAPDDGSHYEGPSMSP